MSTHKTAELTGPLLDAAVALAEGLHPYNFRNKWCLIVNENEDETVVYEPSVDWERAGPIIDREDISVQRVQLLGTDSVIVASIFRAGGFSSTLQIGAGWWIGETRLQAAMRAYVASKFGDEVELP